YRHGAFVARHGSSNRSVKVGYDVVFIPFHNGKPASGPTPFFSGLVPDPHQREVYGRPVGVAVATDGSLLISDDGSNLIWRVTYQKGARAVTKVAGLHEMRKEGMRVDAETLSRLSPYITQHINRYGEYRIDLNRQSPPINYPLPILSY